MRGCQRSLLGAVWLTGPDDLVTPAQWVLAPSGRKLLALQLPLRDGGCCANFLTGGPASFSERRRCQKQKCEQEETRNANNMQKMRNAAREES